MQASSSYWRRLAGHAVPSFCALAVRPFSLTVVCVCLLGWSLGACQSEISHAADVSQDIQTCQPGASPLVLDLNDSTKTGLKFQCESTLTTLLPAPKQEKTYTHFCRDSACQAETPLNGLKLQVSDSNEEIKALKAQEKTYTLSATDLPDAPYTVYFVCAVQSANVENAMRGGGIEAKQQKCVVQVSVWGKTATEVSPSNVCKATPNEAIALKVNAPASVTFGCGDKRGLSPALLDYVFQLPAGEKGLTAVPLQSLVPKATLIANRSGEPSKKTAAYTLSVPELPEAGPVQLVYKCAALKSAPVSHVVLQQEEDQVPKEECRVVIEVAKRPTSSGSDDETSGERATSLSAVWALALGVLTHFLNRV
ncbi:SAG-related sequence [Besnoitia besnoiti]|uniref:SAG-related sequence n=1 Tax=Besnoitia besnoiti TaxID=94643 RepID=A0A2A9MM29_BESBE|nr:SAG-related sequence [Besnoitia besnoiti]PFH36552.1 SAG-related sequence [Besnoitia besnoiti]